MLNRPSNAALTELISKLSLRHWCQIGRTICSSLIESTFGHRKVSRVYQIFYVFPATKFIFQTFLDFITWTVIEIKYKIVPYSVNLQRAAARNYYFSKLHQFFRIYEYFKLKLFGVNILFVNLFPLFLSRIKNPWFP